MMAAKKKESSIVPVEVTQPVVLAPSEWLKGWNKLEVRDKDIITTETKSIFEQHTKFKQNVAMHLLKVRKILLPLKLYETYLYGLNKQKIISRSTANRYVREYEYMQLALPAPVFQQALDEDRKINVSLIEHIPPPKGDDPEENKVWLERVAAPGKKLKPVGNVAEASLAITFAQVKNAYGHLPANHKTRQKWVTDLCGAALHMLGVTTGQTINPSPLPDHMLKKRGRPRKDA